MGLTSLVPEVVGVAVGITGLLWLRKNQVKRARERLEKAQAGLAAIEDNS